MHAVPATVAALFLPGGLGPPELLVLFSLLVIGGLVVGVGGFALGVVLGLVKTDRLLGGSGGDAG